MVQTTGPGVTRSRLRPTRAVALAASARFLGPGSQTWDFSLRRNFRLTERFDLRFQADIFNAFNRTNFRDMDSNLSNAAFGTISTSGPPRNIQFGLKLTFLNEIRSYLCNLCHCFCYRPREYGDNGQFTRRRKHVSRQGARCAPERDQVARSAAGSNSRCADYG